MCELDVKFLIYSMYTFQPLTFKCCIAPIFRSTAKAIVNLSFNVPLRQKLGTNPKRMYKVQQRKLPLGLGSILRLKLGTMQSKGIVLYLVMWTRRLTNYLWPCSNFNCCSTLSSKMAKTVGKTSCVHVYNSCIPPEPFMVKYKYTTIGGPLRRCIQSKRALFLCQLWTSWSFYLLALF